MTNTSLRRMGRDRTRAFEGTLLCGLTRLQFDCVSAVCASRFLPLARRPREPRRRFMRRELFAVGIWETASHKKA